MFRMKLRVLTRNLWSRNFHWRKNMPKVSTRISGCRSFSFAYKTLHAPLLSGYTSRGQFHYFCRRTQPSKKTQSCKASPHLTRGTQQNKTTITRAHTHKHTHTHTQNKTSITRAMDDMAVDTSVEIVAKGVGDTAGKGQTLQKLRFFLASKDY